MKVASLTLLAFIAVAILGYAAYRIYEPLPQPSVPGPNIAACGDRPADVVAYDRQLDLAGVNLGKIAVGKLDMETSQKVVKVLTAAARSAVVVEYLTCEAEERGDIDKSDRAQVNYLRSMFLFMQTNPTAEQFTEWQRTNSFPKHTSQLALPNFEDDGGKKVLKFRGNEPFLPVRFINSGGSDLQVWLEHFPDNIFYPSPGIGPWKITAGGHQDLIIVFMHVTPSAKEYPFQIQIAGGDTIDAEIVLSSLSTQAKYDDLSKTLTKQFASLQIKGNADAAKYELANNYVAELFPTVDAAARNIVTWQALTDVDEWGAALKALDKTVGQVPASKFNPAFYDILANTYFELGDTKRSAVAISHMKEVSSQPTASRM